MRRLTISLVAVAVVLCLSVLLMMSCMHGRYTWNPHEYETAVLKEDAFLLIGWGDSGSVMARLRAGTVLYAPNAADMSVTDPGDMELHKLYVRVPSDMEGKLAFFPMDRDHHGITNFVHILNLAPTHHVEDVGNWEQPFATNKATDTGAE